MKTQSNPGDQLPTDDLDLNPEFQNMVEDMAEKFFEVEDPAFAELMKQVQNGERSLPRGQE